MFFEHYISSDAPYVEIFSLPHILYILFCGLTIFLLVKFRKLLTEKRDTVCKIVLWITIFQQVVLQYGWYIFATDIFWKDGLPSHLCRISSIFVMVFLITKNPKAMDIVFCFGTFAIASFFYPKNCYHLLHINGLSYMINHLVTVAMPVFAALAYGWRPTWAGFRRSVKLFTLYFPVMLLANRLFDGNYLYMTDRPFAFLDAMPVWIYNPFIYLFSVGVFALITVIVRTAIAKFSKKPQEVNV